MKPGESNPRRGAARLLPGPLLPALAALALAGCAHTYDMKVDALSLPKLDHASSYQIVNRNPTVESDSLRYKEAEKAVKVALSGRGMYEAPPGQAADVIVNLDYGMSPPRVTEEVRSNPIYTTVPGQLRSQTVLMGYDRAGNPIYTVMTVQDPPTTEYLGSEDRVVPVVTYEKYLRLSARENRPVVDGRQPQEVWSVDVTSEGPSSNLRKYIPLMAAASIGYIGKATNGQQTVRLKDDKSTDAGFVKKGL